MQNPRRERNSLIGLLAFGGISAIGGMLGLLTDTLGMEPDILTGTPFSGFVIPALILGIIVGGSQLVALYGVIRRTGWGVTAAGIAGCIMMGWIIGQVLLLGSDPGIMRNLQVLCFVIGLLETTLGVQLVRGSDQVLRNTGSPDR